MLALAKCFRLFKPDARIVEDIAKLAATEREVRTLETLIQYISELEGKDGEHLSRIVELLPAGQRPRSLAEL